MSRETISSILSSPRRCPGKSFYRNTRLSGLLVSEVLDLVAKINADECVGCGACEDVCPQSAIKVTDVAVVIEKDCVDCGACVDECPNNAITVDE
jgi:NAD-dependent dihydropyrimidine dehydrogenase PreA subunit